MFDLFSITALRPCFGLVFELSLGEELYLEQSIAWE